MTEPPNSESVVGRESMRGHGNSFCLIAVRVCVCSQLPSGRPIITRSIQINIGFSHSEIDRSTDGWGTVWLQKRLSMPTPTKKFPLVRPRNAEEYSMA